MCSFNRNTTWITSSPLTNPDAQYSKIVLRGFRENLVAEKPCSNGHPTPSEATYITAERQKRQQLRHVAESPHGRHLDLTADGAIKWRAHRRTRRWGGSCPELAQVRLRFLLTGIS